MSEDIINVGFYILSKIWEFLFSSYIVDGVSIGSFIVSCLIMGMVFKFLLAVPKVLPRKRGRYYDVYKQDDNGSTSYHRHKY